jgi:hypothetical protein
MRVPGLILSDDRLMAEIRRDASLERRAIHQRASGSRAFGISKKVARLRPIGVVKG